MLKQLCTVLIIVLGLSGATNKANQDNTLNKEEYINDSLTVTLNSISYSKNITEINNQLEELDSLLIKMEDYEKFEKQNK